MRTDNEVKAIETYKKAASLCEAGGDSLCLGECYEQLSAMNGVLGNHVEAKYYFDKSMPLLEKYGTPKNICTALNNYGSLLSMMGRYPEAIQYLKKSTDFCKDIERYKAYAKGMNNLAASYNRLGDFDKAIETYETCLRFNTEHQFNENKIANYLGLHIVYQEKGDYKLASDFLIKRYLLKDSIVGIKIQNKIASLEDKYERKQKEVELQASKNKLLVANKRISMFRITLFFVTIIAGLLLWFFYKRRQQISLELKQNQENLSQLTQTLIRKNTGIKLLEDQVAELSSSISKQPIPIHSEENLLSQTILTQDDWIAFKLNFEKTHPGYISNLRKAYPTISEAEERLFIFLKLNLTRSEIASILGISPDTVKKTRNRLRKRLQLVTKDSLDDFVAQF